MAVTDIADHVRNFLTQHRYLQIFLLKYYFDCFEPNRFSEHFSIKIKIPAI